MSRKKVFMIDGEACHKVTWTQHCTGCLESGEGQINSNDYPWDPKAKCHIGAGCDECGYTGKRRQTFFVPVQSNIDEEVA